MIMIINNNKNTVTSTVTAFTLVKINQTFFYEAS